MIFFIIISPVIIFNAGIKVLSLNFGTDNICFVPEGQNLIIYDIYNMRRLCLDIRSWGVFFNKAHGERIRTEIDSARERWGKHQKSPGSIARGKKAMDSFLDAFPWQTYPLKDFLNVKEIVHPLEITFWVRCSDTSLESFYMEDYQLPAHRPPHKRLPVPVIGSVYLSAIGDFELSIHEELLNEGFFLKIPPDSGITIAPLSCDEILPLDEGYFGAYSASEKGRIINLTHDAKISGENLCSTPLYRIGSYMFINLYCHLRTNVEFDVLHRFPERKIPYTRALLSEIGFHLEREHQGNEIYRREDSFVHLYTNAAGKETLGALYLPPFFLISSHEGRLDPATRTKLMEEFIPRFKRR